MAKCRYCKKAIKLIEVVDDHSPTGLRWKAFDKKRTGKAYHAHQCPKYKLDPQRPLPPARMPYKED